MKIAIHPQQEQEPHRMPHQGLWFVGMLLVLLLLLLLGKTVAAAQCVIA